MTDRQQACNFVISKWESFNVKWYFTMEANTAATKIAYHSINLPLKIKNTCSFSKTTDIGSELCFVLS